MVMANSNNRIGMLSSAVNKGKKKLSSNLTRTLVLSGLAAAIFFLLWRIDDNVVDDIAASPSAVTTAVTDQQREEEVNDDALDTIKELYDAVSVERLTKLALQYKQAYSTAEPFPHIAIDGLFPEKYLRLVLKENPESNIIDGCIFGNTDGCWSLSQQNMKSFINQEEQMGFYTRILFNVMKSSTFVHFLEDLTNIQHIIPDPHYHGSGMHFTASGGHLDVHADFNRYETYGLHRRVNALLYLNNDWPVEYGGNLELWSQNMKECTQKILPTFNRLIIFASTDFTYHGHPQPLACPKHRARRSMALYYYTSSRPNSECINNDCLAKGITTKWQKPVGCSTCEETTCYHVDKPMI